MNDDVMTAVDNVAALYLMHEGTPGMHWYRNGPGKRWQTQAVYAHGMPDPNALQKTVDTKTDAQIKAATSRLQAENDLKRAMINSMKVNQEYNELLHANEGAALKKFMKMAKAFSKSSIGKITGNAIKYRAYTLTRDKYSEEMAKALFDGVLKVDGKKKPSGGGEDQQQSGDGGGNKNKKKEQKNQNGGG